MNPNPPGIAMPLATSTDLARQQYYEQLLENSRKKIALLRARNRTSTGQRIRIEIVLEENFASQIEKELKHLKNQTPIL